MYFLDVFFFFLHQGVDPDRFSDKSRGRRQIYKLMCLAASFVRFANRWNRDGSNPLSLCIQQKRCASEKKIFCSMRRYIRTSIRESAKLLTQ